jgi:hypothetical protein
MKKIIFIGGWSTIKSISQNANQYGPWRFVQNVKCQEIQQHDTSHAVDRYCK